MNPIKAYITYVEPNEAHDGVRLRECKEVIFCEDCQWAEPYQAVDGGMYFRCSEMGVAALRAYDFCSFGERKEKTDDTI